jgi:hypothetical protein
MADQGKGAGTTPEAGKPNAPTKPQTLTQTLRDTLTLSRAALPYFAAALVASLVMGWYFYVFVPKKLEYFIGLRFRTLAVVSGQIKGKAEALGQSLSSVPLAHASANKVWTPEQFEARHEALERATTDYLRLLVPDIQLEKLEKEGSPGRPGLHLAVHGTQPRGSVDWDAVASQATAASVSEFDDLVLADSSGRVLWQRERTTPRLGDLKELLFQSDDKGTILSPSWALRPAVPLVDKSKILPDTVALKPVRGGAVSTTMLVQSIQIDSPHVMKLEKNKLFVAAFVSRSQLEREAMRVPLAWLAVVWLPVTLLFLALPFIKLATMNAKERFSAINLALMAIATLAAAGLGAVVPFGPLAESEAGDRVLENLAKEIDTRIADETNQVLSLGKSIDATRITDTLSRCDIDYLFWSTNNLCDLWGTLPWKPSANALRPELDVAIWLDEDGGQLVKWTTKAQLTGPTSHAQFEHFRSLASGRLWKLGPAGKRDPSTWDNQTEFTIEPLRAPTTAELAVVYARPLKNGPEDPKFLALNVRPHALVDVVMPPGYGFAVVSADGRVLFHSTDGLSLEENFFREVSDAPGVRDRVRGDTPRTWSGDYHGSPHRIHVRPAVEIRDSGWRIVTFQDLTPALASVVEHQADTFRLSFLNLVMLLVSAATGLLYTKLRGRDVRDLLSAAPPDPARLQALLIPLIVSLPLLVAAGFPAGHQSVDALYGAFVALPLATLGICLWARWPDDEARPDREHASRWTQCELAFVVLLVGAVPSAGIARVVHRVHDTRATEQWLTQAHQRLAMHAEEARRRASRVAYPESRRAMLVESRAFEGNSASTDAFSYLDAVPWFASDTPAGVGQASAHGQRGVRALLAVSLFNSTSPPLNDVKITAFRGSPILETQDPNGAPLAASVWSSGTEFRWLRWGLMALILAGTLAAAYWARYHLSPPRASGVPTFNQVLGLLGSEGSHGVMLIGPPRTQKDTLVTKAVKAPICRFPLLDATIDDKFRGEADAIVTARAADRNCLDSKGRLWIHVSNLEAQLVSAEQRTAVLDFLESLLKRKVGEPARIVVVTTNIDPIAQFKEIFTTERKGIYDDGIPEVQFSRSSLLLSRFHRCFFPIKEQSHTDPWWNYDPEDWPRALAWEAADYPPLVEVSSAVTAVLQDAKGLRPRVERAELLQLFQNKALATYDLIWASCTRCEKIALIQLAQEGFVTTANREIVWGLVNKGLIVERPMPAIFNASFREYLRDIEHNKVVEQWEREDGDGLWVVAGRLVASTLIAGGLFYLTTQDFSVDSLLPVVSGTGLFGAPAVRALFARISARAAPVATV